MARRPSNDGLLEDLLLLLVALKCDSGLPSSIVSTRMFDFELEACDFWKGSRKATLGAGLVLRCSGREALLLCDGEEVLGLEGSSESRRCEGSTLMKVTSPLSCVELPSEGSAISKASSWTVSIEEEPV